MWGPPTMGVWELINFDGERVVPYQLRAFDKVIEPLTVCLTKRWIFRSEGITKDFFYLFCEIHI